MVIRLRLCVLRTNSDICLVQCKQFGFYNQHKFLRTIANAPWYTPNKILHTDLKITTIRKEITKSSVNYRDKISTHANELASTPLEEEEPRRLKRSKLTDLTTRFSLIT
jgi:hypothetical protein